MQSDRNLLFGILAVQMDFVDRDALVEAMHQWVLDKQRTLGDVLVEHRALTSERRVLLDALVDEHLRGHASDPAQSLAAVSPEMGLRRKLAAIEDPDLRASLAITSESAAEQNNSDQTLPRDPTIDSALVRRYRMLRPHAAGGIGEVSVAFDEELKREVALKEIKDRYADDRDTRLRFVREAEITGGLEHPGIVPVYGLGHYSDGRPYYAMRFIRGDSLEESIDEYHRRWKRQAGAGGRTLELRKLLGRFVDVCNAIEYAHSRGVLHRDLKPGNVMLGGYGETLVVDWGLAKSVGDEDTFAPAEPAGSSVATLNTDYSPTLQGTTVGTPQYMSPEQAQGRLDLLSTSSDVYSLGATLYRLLTGQPPVDDGDAGSTIKRVARGDFPPPRTLDANVPKALEAICLKAMALDPADRYASAAALADDVEHWLADEPVAAAKESPADRAFRWARRHRHSVQAAALALVVVTLVSLIAAVSVDRSRQEATRQRDAAKLAQQQEQRQRELAQADRDRAEAAREQADRALERALAAERRAVDEADTARAVSNFLVGLFQGPDILGLGGYEFEGGGQGRKNLTAEEMLDFGAENIVATLPDNALVQAKLLDVIGVTYLSTGRARKAEPLLLRALDIRRQYLQAPHLDLADSLRSVGMLRFIQGYPTASEMIREARAMRRELVPADDPAAVLDEYCLAWSLIEFPQALSEAEQLFRRVLEVRQQAENSPNRHIAYAMLGTAMVELMRGRTSQALELVNDSMSLFREEETGTNPLEPLMNFAMAVANLTVGNAALARSGVVETMHKAKTIYGERHPALLFIQSEMAWYLRDLGELALADELFTSSVELARESIGDHPRTAGILGQLALVQHGLGKPEQSAALYREAEEIWERAAPDDPFMAFVYTNHGVLLLEQGDAERAEARQRSALRLAADSPSILDVDEAMIECRLCEVLLKNEQFDEVESLAVSAHRRLDEALGSENAETKRARRVLAALYAATGRTEKAATYRDSQGN